jgi:hypothetical protein
MVLAAAATIWVLWSGWLLAQHLGAPAPLTRSAAGLLVAELAVLAVHSFGCGEEGCGAAAQAAGDAATYDVPGLAGLLVAAGTAYAWRRSASAAR